jgi:hypothetical protein
MLKQGYRLQTSPKGLVGGVNGHQRVLFSMIVIIFGGPYVVRNVLMRIMITQILA